MKQVNDKAPLKVASFPVGIVVSSFNPKITNQLKQGAIERLLERGLNEQDILLVEVPGAIEIPVTAAFIAKHHDVKALIALGSVVRGETDHYDCVFEQINYGCQRVALDYQVPVIFEVLMTDNEEQAFDRLGGSHGHKGVSAADCAIEMVTVFNEIGRLHE